MALTDEQLVSALNNGNLSAFNDLYKRYSNRLLYYFYRMLGNSNEKAQDFLQDIFIKLIDKASTFDSSKKFSTWIFSIAHNMCKNEYRRLQVRKDLSIEKHHENITDNDIDFDIQDIDLDEFKRELFTELDIFDEIHKSVFLLHYREGFSLKDIGQTLNISEGTVKSRLFTARQLLKDILIKNGIFEHE